MNILFFDTETTGLPLFKEPSSHPDQPHIVQLAWIMNDIEHDYIIKPDGWIIHESASNIHGITTEIALEKGYPLAFVLGIFYADFCKAEKLVAHNASFDLRLIKIQCLKIGLESFIDSKPYECTMMQSKNIVKSPPTEKMIKAGFNSYKNPNLQETYVHFFGKNFDGAHNALADVRACRDVYNEMQKL